MIKPKKLIRKNITEKLKPSEWEFIEDKQELNKLYALKVQEELKEIQDSQHNDIMEFVDLIQVAFSFAKQNGFTHEELANAMAEKSIEKGAFSNIALNNLNPENPSNALYFSIDSHSPDTLQEGNFMVGTSEQYRKVFNIIQDVKHDIEIYVSQCVIQKQMIFLNGRITWSEFPELLRKTQLTPEEFIRRAENTFKTK